MTRQTLTVVTVTIEDREDNGLRVFSRDLPGLILSGSDRDQVCANIAVAIEALFKHRGLAVTVHPTKSVDKLLELPSPRDLDMHVQHEQFVVAMAEAA